MRMGNESSLSAVRAALAELLLKKEKRQQIRVDREALTRIGEQLQSCIAVSSAFRGTIVKHVAIVTTLSARELAYAWEPYRFGRRDLDPMLPALTAEEGCVVTLRRHDAISNSTWSSSAIATDYYKALSIDHSIQSEVRLPANIVHRIAFVRRAGLPAMTEEDRELVHQFHRGLVHSWESAPQAVSARVGTVLSALIHGRSTKEIALELGLGRATIERDIQRVYARYRVSCRRELLASMTLDDDDFDQWLGGWLTPRQAQIARLLLTDIREYDLACMLGISEHTFHAHVQHVFRQFDVSSRVELMARFIERPIERPVTDDAKP